ncbi:DUF805 domain-containing protein [Aquipseudomonas alcaligenes]|uniref:DUF805 domain-containing protein n=1 Tax=Aquipseudomonas alcaligenes TaxID=43263 RepID=UPI0009EF477B|nr:DUF805 domain-containing protein [Pseudomonas alcaligenes]
MARIEPVFENTPEAFENPYRTSNTELLESEQPTHSIPRIFDFQGRISLSRYWLFHIIFVVIILTLFIAFFAAGLRHQPIILLSAVAVILIPSGILSISLLMRRARDLGWGPGWGIAAMLIPGIGFLIILPLAILPGKKAPNKYGHPNPPLSIQAKALTLLLVISSIAGLMALFAYYPEYGAPEILNSLINP